MSEDRFGEIERLYHEATLRRPEERAAFLDQACGGDKALRHEVESLLSLPTDADGFLSRPALEEAARAGQRALEADPWPTIPGYTLIRVLGEGGMGVVYLAWQETPFRRLVALKLIKPGMDTRQVVARFETERQALALMDHPNIAAVFDAGSTTQGRPYFVMEFVEGVSITEYCDRGRLSTGDRLALFVQVCAAVQHAHQKGVIHRDLKPSNVIVAERDGHAVPKVIDFGTAKAMGGVWNATATQVGEGMVIGTLEYMSPEQAALSTDIDTATDVYSLGVLLYELLVGRLPFDTAELRAAGHDEMRRVIRESEPPKPSSRVDQRTDKSGAAARARQTDAPGLTRQLRGDLDWITLKALEKDRKRRYATVAAFATDIGRFLGHQPVDARPPSSAYRVQKFVRRHRVGVVTGAGGLAALIAALVVATSLYVRAEGARQHADYQAYVATLAAADAHLKAGEYLRAERLLLASGPEFRDNWEWRYLYAITNTSAATAFLRDDPSVATDLCRRELAVALDGRQVLLAGGHLVQAWDVERSTVSTLYSTEHDLLAIDPTGRFVVVGIGDGAGGKGRFERLDVVDVSKGTSVSTLKHQGAFAAAFDGNGGRVATASLDGIVVWDAKSGTQLGDRIGLAIARPELVNFKLAPDGTSVIQHPNVWPLGSRHSIALGVDADFPSCAVFSPDAQRVLTTSIGGLQEWDVRTGTLIRKLRDGVIPPSQLAFSPDSSLLAAGREADPALDIVEMTSGHVVATLRTTDTIRPTDFAFSHDGQRLFAMFGTERRYIRMWDVARLRAAAGFPIRSRMTMTDPLASMRINKLPSLPADAVPSSSLGSGRALSADGRQVAFALSNVVGVWDVPSQALSRQVVLPHVQRLALSGDAGRLLAASPDGLFFSDLDGRPPTLLDRGVMTALALSADGSLAVAGRSGGGAEVWSLPSGSGRLAIQSASPATALLVDAGRMQLAMATRSQSQRDVLELWDLKSGRQVWKRDMPRIEALGFSAECGRIAIGSTGTDPNLLLLDAATGSTLLTLSAAESRVQSVAFSRNCRRLAQATDSAIGFWDTSTGVELLTLRMPSRTPTYVIQFSPDDQSLLALDSWIRVYDAASVYHPGASLLVDRLFKELFFSEDVVARLRSDPELAPQLRTAAIELAGRYGDSPTALRRESQRIALFPDQSAEQYVRARRMAELCVRLEPGSGASQLILGMALYRTGDYGAAVDAFGRADSLASRSALVKRAFLAMAQAKLGRADAARAELEGLRAELAPKPSPMSPQGLPPRFLPPRPDWPEVTSLMKEAEALLAGKDRRQ